MDRPNSQILRCELVYVLLCYFLADEVVVLFHVGQSAHFSPPEHVDSKILENALNPYPAGLSQTIWRVIASVWPFMKTTESHFFDL
jgi:hypothetical protein